MAKTLKLNRIEFDPQTGTVSLRWEKLTDDGESLGFHRTTVSDYVDPKTGDVTPVSVAQQIAAVDDHMTAMNYPATTADDAVLAHALREFGKTPTADMAALMDAATLSIIEENKGLAGDKAVLQTIVLTADNAVKG